MIDTLPDIDDYLKTSDDDVPVQIPGLENFVHAIIANTKLTEDQAKIILRLFFQEVRNGMLRGEKLLFHGFGTFYISSPLSGNKKKIFPTLKLAAKFKNKLNGR